jgi:hypothetical protein
MSIVAKSTGFTCLHPAQYTCIQRLSLSET